MQIIEIGVEKKKPAKKKSIELCVALNNEFEFNKKISVAACVDNYDRIELICRNYSHNALENFDLIFCIEKNANRSDGVLYLGHWNDGVV